MTQTLTRRSLVAAAPAAIIAATAPALADQAPDAQLLALRAPFDRTWRAYLKALEVHAPAEAEWFKDSRADAPKKPAMVAAEALVARTSASNREVVEAMCEIPARTIGGLAFKARVSLDHEDNLFEELITSIMDDIIAMAGGAHA